MMNVKITMKTWRIRRWWNDVIWKGKKRKQFYEIKIMNSSNVIGFGFNWKITYSILWTNKFHNAGNIRIDNSLKSFFLLISGRILSLFSLHWFWRSTLSSEYNTKSLIVHHLQWSSIVIGSFIASFIAVIWENIYWTIHECFSDYKKEKRERER